MAAQDKESGAKLQIFLHIILLFEKKKSKKLHILRKCAIYAAEIRRFSDKTVRLQRHTHTFRCENQMITEPVGIP